jgi:hypothetical protein
MVLRGVRIRESEVGTQTKRGKKGKAGVGGGLGNPGWEWVGSGCNLKKVDAFL